MHFLQKICKIYFVPVSVFGQNPFCQFSVLTADPQQLFWQLKSAVFWDQAILSLSTTRDWLWCAIWQLHT